jgi:hypothetical protein
MVFAFLFAAYSATNKKGSFFAIVAVIEIVVIGMDSLRMFVVR